MMINTLLLVLFISILYINVSGEYTAAALADQVISLPGAEELDITFNHFSGYLTINGTKNMHYWLVESMNDPVNDPLAFWTNGGPGCSGLLGFLTEQGPFRPNADLSLSFNDYAWNKVSNMVFIEQPCGVGFSYSEDSSDYKTGDDQAAIDNYLLIQSFLDRFPQFKSNDLYITSESYGGHYMPTLAQEIVNQNNLGVYSRLNFKGFAVGNPQTTFYSAIPASLETYWGHQLVSKPLWDKYTTDCLDKRIPNITECEFIFTDIYIQVERTLNPYALDYPTCESDSKHKFGRSQRTWLLNHLLFDSSDKLKSVIGLEPVDGYEPCEEDYMTSYLNLPEVKQALHVNSDITWADCSRTIKYKQTDGKNSMVPIYQSLLTSDADLSILVYSGDDDGVCATVGSQSWVWDMMTDINIDTDGKPWQAYTYNDQTAGYLTKWSDVKFSFMTVHGAGHEVPTYKPDVALYLWSSYLNGELFSS